MGALTPFCTRAWSLIRSLSQLGHQYTCSSYNPSPPRLSHIREGGLHRPYHSINFARLARALQHTIPRGNSPRPYIDRSIGQARTRFMTTAQTNLHCGGNFTATEPVISGSCHLTSTLRHYILSAARPSEKRCRLPPETSIMSTQSFPRYIQHINLRSQGPLRHRHQCRP